jgi:hypothetical protein
LSIVEPVVTRTVLEHIFERPEKACHGSKSDPVEVPEEGQIRLIEIDQRQGSEGDADAR